MSGEDKTLKETIAEAVQGNKETQKAEVVETEQGISANETAGETETGKTPVYVSGIDISDIPEQDRPRVKELLEKKAKLLEGGYQEKFKKVAELAKTQEELNNLGLSMDEARGVLAKHLEGKKHSEISNTNKNAALKTLDKLIGDAPYEQKAALEQMRTIIAEETEVGEIKKRLDNMDKLMGVYQQSALNARKDQVDKEIGLLSQKYGAEIVEKHRSVLEERGVQYPNMLLSKIFAIEVPMEEIEQAILLKGKKPLTEEKKKAISSSGSGVTSASEKIDVGKKSYSELILNSLRK